MIWQFFSWLGVSSLFFFWLVVGRKIQVLLNPLFATLLLSPQQTAQRGSLGIRERESCRAGRESILDKLTMSWKSSCWLWTINRVQSWWFQISADITALFQKKTFKFMSHTNQASNYFWNHKSKKLHSTLYELILQFVCTVFEIEFKNTLKTVLFFSCFWLQSQRLSSHSFLCWNPGSGLGFFFLCSVSNRKRNLFPRWQT